MVSLFSRVLLLVLLGLTTSVSFSFAKVLQQTDSGSHDLGIRKLLFFDNNTKLITLADRKIRVWDIESGVLLNTYRTESYEGSGGSIYHAALTNNDKYLIVGGFFADGVKNKTDLGELLVIDTKTFKIQKRLKGHTNSIAWIDSNDKYFISVDGENNLIFWDSKSLKALKKIKIPLIRSADGISLNKNSTKVALAGYLLKPKFGMTQELGGVLVVDLQTEKITSVNELMNARYPKFYKDDKLLYSTKYLSNIIPSRLNIADPNNLKKKKSVLISLREQYIGAYCINPKKEEIYLSGSNNGYIKNLSNNQTIKTIKETIMECKYSADGKMLALGDSDGNIFIYNSEKKLIFKSPVSAKDTWGVGIDVKNKTIAWGHTKEEAITQESIFDENPFEYALSFKNGVQMTKVEPYSEEYTRSFNTLDNLEIFTPTGGANSQLEVYFKGNPWLKIKRDKFSGLGHGSASLVPDQLYTLSGSITGTIDAYELRYGGRIHQFDGHAAAVFSLAVSEYGEFLISSSIDKTVKIWSLKDIIKKAKNQTPNKRYIQNLVNSYKKNKNTVAFFKKQGYSLDFNGVVEYRKKYNLPLSNIPPKSKPLATIFASDNEWIIWNEDGYYASSSLGDEKIGWSINNGTKKWANWVGANQFERALFQPKFISEWIFSHGDKKLYKKYNLKKDALTSLLKNPPTQAKIIAPQTASYTNKQNIRIDFSLDKKIDNYTIFVNDIPVAHEKNPKVKKHTKTIPIFNKFNKVHIETMNSNTMAKSQILIKSDIKTPQKGDLYLLSIGVKNFKYLKDKDLRYTTKDALEIVNHYKKQEGKNFNNVYTKLIADEAIIKPTKENIQDAVSFIKSAEAKDTVIIFLASHGVSDIHGNYYFVPQDAKEEDISKLDKPNEKISSMVPWNLFFDQLQGTLGKRVLIVDTCESKNISGKYELYSLIKRSASSSFAILTASKGNELSQEFYQEKHGLFTFALLEGLKGKADENKDKKITLQEAYEYASKIVFLNHDTRFGSQTPQLNGSKYLKDIVISSY